MVSFIFGPSQAEMSLRACAKCADSHHPDNAHGLIRASVFIETFFSNSGSGQYHQTARMRFWFMFDCGPFLGNKMYAGNPYLHAPKVGQLCK